MQTRRSFLKVAAAVPLAGACGTGFYNLASPQRTHLMANSADSAKYLGQPKEYWLSQLGTGEGELASWALAAFGTRSVRGILRVLGQSAADESTLHERAIEALAFMGSAGDCAMAVILFPAESGWRGPREVRRVAIEKLNLAAIHRERNLPNTIYLDWLLRALLDAEADIRRQAAETMCHVAGRDNHDWQTDQHVIPALVAALSDSDTDVVRAAVSSLAFLDAPKVIFNDLLRDGDAYVRVIAAKTLLSKRAGDLGALEQILFEAMSDKEGRVRHKGILAISATPHLEHQALPLFIRMLHDEDRSVLWAAIEALKDRASEIVQELSELFMNHPDVQLAMAAAAALISAADSVPEASLPLTGLRKWFFHDDPQVRFVAYKYLHWDILCRHPRPELYLWLAQAGVMDADEGVRAEAVAVAAKFRDQAVELLEPLASDPCAAVRDSVAWWLGFVENDKAPVILRSMLNDEAEMVRASAADALDKLLPGDKGATHVLTQLLFSADYWICRMAAESFATAEPENAAILLSALAAEAPQTRAAAVYGLRVAIRHLPGPMRYRVCRSLVEAANDDDLAVRAEARRADWIISATNLASL